MSILALSIAILAPQASATEARLIQQRFGDCVVSKNAKEAKAYILDHTDNRQNTPTGRLIAKLSDGPCMYRAAGNVPGRMRFFGDSMRYALADSLIRRELLAAAPVSAAAAPLAHPPVDVKRILETPLAFGGQEAQEERERRVIQAQAVAAMSQLGECVVRRAPAEALQLFRTSPASPEESAAFAALNPAIGGCVPAGATVELTKANLRGTIAVNYYRLAFAPEAAAAQTATR